jgi:hypothetical protein
MQNCVIYARFSSDKQREESIEGQVRECRAFAQANDLEVIHVYVDRAKSARTDHRPDFLKMIKDSAKGLYKYIVVYTLDRFSRSRYDSVTYKAKLKKNGVKVLSAKENIKDDPSGIILESVLEGYAEYYSAELAQKVKRGMTDSILEHKWPGTEVPFGYRKKEDGTLAVHPVAGPVIKDIFVDVIQGHTRAEIARMLTAKQYKTENGRAISYAMVNRILKNDLYTGRYHWGALDIPDFAPALISQETFADVQKILSTQRRKRKNSPAYILTGKIYCGICGTPMTGVCGTSKNGEKYRYYRCASKSNKIRENRTPCAGRYVPVKWLDGLVFKTTLSILNSPECRAEIARQAMEAQKRYRQSDPEEKRLRTQKADLEKRLTNSVKAIEAGVVSETITANIKKYEQEVKDLQAAIDELKLKKTGPEITEPAIEFFFEQLAKRAKTEGANLDLFFDFIQRVEVFDDHIMIYYSYLPTKKTPNPIEVRCSRNIQLVTPE